MNSLTRIFHLCLLIMLLFSSERLIGQGLAEKYFNVSFQYSKQNIKTKAGPYNVAYTNSLGSFSSLYEISPEYSSNLYQFGVGFGKFKGFNHKICFDLLRGKIEKGQFGYFLGYNFAFEGNKNDFLINPSLGLLAGNTNIILEEIRNKDGIINLYGENYPANYVSITQKFSSWIVRPSCSFTYLIKQYVGLNVEVGYDFAIEGENGNYKVDFVEFKDSPKEIEHAITDENYSVIGPAGKLSKSRIYGLTGFYWSIGLSIYKSYDYD